MGSYNYEALHKHTPSIKRAWMPDPLTSNHGGYINGVRTIQEPHLSGYGNPLQDRILLAQATQEPHMNGYGNPLQDRIMLAQAAQAQAAQAAQVQAQVHAQMIGCTNGGVNHYGLPKYNLHNDPSFPIGLIPHDHLIDVVGERDHYANNVYANGLPIQRPIFPSIHEPIREPRRERRVREPVIREFEPIRELSTSQSPAHIPEAVAEPPLAGMIFGCTSDTYIECMQMKLFALPAANKAEVLRVAPGTKLFLYNYRARELSGIFEATSHGDMDLEPDAFQGFFPAQVRIRCIEKCPNLPLKAFKEAMSENFEKKNKFKYSLNDIQVRKLITLFRQELKYWQKQRAQQEHKIMSSGLQPGLRPGYPNRNEVNLMRHLRSEPTPFFQNGKRICMF